MVMTAMIVAQGIASLISKGIAQRVGHDELQVFCRPAKALTCFSRIMFCQLFMYICRAG